MRWLNAVDLNPAMRFLLSVSAAKSVRFQHGCGEIFPLLETFRAMVNRVIDFGLRHGVRGRFKLIEAVYEDFKRFGLHTHYTLSACEVARAILKNYRRKHRVPRAKRLF